MVLDGRQPSRFASASAAGFERYDRGGDFLQVIIELMVPAAQAMNASLWNRARVKIDVRRWCHAKGSWQTTSMLCPSGPTMKAA